MQKKRECADRAVMTYEDRRLLVDNLAEMRELKGELREFKDHVMGRVERLEKREGEQNKKTYSTLSLLISFTALAVSIIVNFFRNAGGK